VARGRSRRGSPGSPPQGLDRGLTDRGRAGQGARTRRAGRRPGRPRRSRATSTFQRRESHRLSPMALARRTSSSTWTWQGRPCRQNHRDQQQAPDQAPGARRPGRWGDLGDFGKRPRRLRQVRHGHRGHRRPPGSSLRQRSTGATARGAEEPTGHPMPPARRRRPGRGDLRRAQTPRATPHPSATSVRRHHSIMGMAKLEITASFREPRRLLRLDLAPAEATTPGKGLRRTPAEARALGRPVRLGAAGAGGVSQHVTAPAGSISSTCGMSRGRAGSPG
jgi:hypothetical protein